MTLPTGEDRVPTNRILLRDGEPLTPEESAPKMPTYVLRKRDCPPAPILLRDHVPAYRRIARNGGRKNKR